MHPIQKADQIEAAQRAMTARARQHDMNTALANAHEGHMKKQRPHENNYVTATLKKMGEESQNDIQKLSDFIQSRQRKANAFDWLMTHYNCHEMRLRKEGEYIVINCYCGEVWSSGETLLAAIEAAMHDAP